MRVPTPPEWVEDYDDAFEQPTQPDYTGCLSVELPDEAEFLGEILGPDGETLVEVYAPSNPVGFAIPSKRGRSCI